MTDQRTTESRQHIEGVFAEMLEAQDKNFVLCATLLAELQRLEAQSDGSTGHALRLCQILHERLEDTEELTAQIDAISVEAL